jgi:cytochrome d ubiquinol oxidase subunit II
METIWFILVAIILVGYVVLDGFDLGAGIINLFVARSHDERRLVLRSVGPVWDGNEVWLLAAGGSLFFAFPTVYAVSFSGFYLPLMMVLWLLILRGVGIELRSHIDDPLWWTACEFLFEFSSFLLALFFGVAIGNVVRGVPIGPDGFFFEPLWTDFSPFGQTGILDWYTVITGLVGVAALTVHGANYVALKTEGPIQTRARRTSGIVWFALVLLTILSLIATLFVRPSVLDNFSRRPWGWVIPVAVLASLASMFYFRIAGRDRAAFLSSSAYLVSMLAGAAFALYPTLLPASTDPAMSLTIHNSKTGQYSMTVGLVWWIVGMLIAVVYFVFLYRSFSGKVSLDDHGGY